MRPPIWGLIASTILLVVFLIIQSRHGNPLDVPIKLLCVSLVPTVVGMIIGGYIKKVKTPIIEAEMENLPLVEPHTSSSIERSAPQSWTDQRAKEYARTDGFMSALFSIDPRAHRSPSMVPTWPFSISIFPLEPI